MITLSVGLDSLDKIYNHIVILRVLNAEKREIMSSMGNDSNRSCLIASRDKSLDRCWLIAEPR